MGEYVGLDVSKEETSFCVKSEDGVTLARGKAPSGRRRSSGGKKKAPARKRSKSAAPNE